MIRRCGGVSSWKMSQETFAVAWTTTPWTLPSNLALGVHPEIDYVKDARSGDGKILHLGRGASRGEF